MLYNTGAIAINGNTATGTGTNWTAAASQVRIGQTLIVLSNPVQLFQITAINSATSLTVTPAASPALSGQKYGVLVTDSLSVDGLAQSMSQLINEYDENIGAWETFASTSANQSITVTINGSPVNIPGIGALARKGVNSDITELKGLTTALSISQGGTGSTTTAGALKNLGLGTAAQRDVGTTAGNVMAVGAFGIGGTGSLYATNTIGEAFNYMKNSGSGIYRTNNSLQIQGLSLQYSPALFFGAVDTYALLTVGYSSGIVSISANTAAGISSATGYAENVLYGTANTTVDSNGFIKKASPIIKLFSTGKYETNAEAEGVVVTRIEEGVYHISGCTGLNSDPAWCGIDGGFDIPMDRNKQPLIWLDYDVNADGSVLVKTYHRTYPAAPEFARNEKNGYADGDPIDIPRDQFVSVRVEMPADSLYNQKIRAAELAMTAGDGE